MTDGIAGVRMALGSSQRTPSAPAGDSGRGRAEPGFAALLDAPAEATCADAAPLEALVLEAGEPVEAGPVVPDAVEGELDQAAVPVGPPGVVVIPAAPATPPQPGSQPSGAGAESGLAAAVIARTGVVVAPGVAKADLPWGGVNPSTVGPEGIPNAGKASGLPVAGDGQAAPAGEAGASAVVHGATKEGPKGSPGASVVPGEAASTPKSPGAAQEVLGSRPKPVAGPQDVGGRQDVRARQDVGAQPEPARPSPAYAPSTSPGGAPAAPGAAPAGQANAPTAQAVAAGPAFQQEVGPRGAAPSPARARRSAPEHAGNAGPAATTQGGSAQTASLGGDPAVVAFRNAMSQATGKAGQPWQDRSDIATGERRFPESSRSSGFDGASDLAPMIRPNEAGEVRPQAGPDGAPIVRRIGRQIAAQPVLRMGGRAELSLAPEELGHLRLSVEVGEAGLRVVIEAARPETADLMRRHVEALRQELRQEGLGQVGVSIGGGDSQPGREASHSAGRGPGRTTGTIDPGASDPAPAPDILASSRPRSAGGSLDLRF